MLCIRPAETLTVADEGLSPFKPLARFGRLVQLLLVVRGAAGRKELLLVRLADAGRQPLAAVRKAADRRELQLARLPGRRPS